MKSLVVAEQHGIYLSRAAAPRGQRIVPSCAGFFAGATRSTPSATVNQVRAFQYPFVVLFKPLSALRLSISRSLIRIVIGYSSPHHKLFPFGVESDISYLHFSNPRGEAELAWDTVIVFFSRRCSPAGIQSFIAGSAIQFAKRNTSSRVVGLLPAYNTMAITISEDSNMKPRATGANRLWANLLAFVAPWLACLLNGGTETDVIGTLALSFLGLQFFLIPQVWAFFVVNRSNEARKHRTALLPEHRDFHVPIPHLTVANAESHKSPSTSSNSSSTSISSVRPEQAPATHEEHPVGSPPPATFELAPSRHSTMAPPSRQPTAPHASVAVTPPPEHPKTVEEAPTVDEIAEAVAEKLEQKPAEKPEEKPDEKLEQKPEQRPEQKPPTRQSTLAVPSRKPTEKLA